MPAVQPRRPEWVKVSHSRPPARQGDWLGSTNPTSSAGAGSGAWTDGTSGRGPRGTITRDQCSPRQHPRPFRSTTVIPPLEDLLPSSPAVLVDCGRFTQFGKRTTVGILGLATSLHN